MNRGFITLHRKIQDHWLWSCEKEFSKPQAFIDLLLLANHEPRTISLGNEIITVERGQHVTSEVKLMARWGWGKTKLRNFLKLLENDGMIIKNSNKKQTTITVCNYDDYQLEKTTDKPQANHKQTISKPQAYTNNNYNNYNNDNNDNNKRYTYVDYDDVKQSDFEQIEILDSQEKMTSKSKRERQPTIDYDEIKLKFNSVCTKYKPIRTLSEKRKKAIRKILKDFTLGELFLVFEKAENSDFMTGNNNRGWHAQFDWIIEENRFIKILEGNYDNRGKRTRMDEIKEQTEQDWFQEWLNGEDGGVE